ncbi:MAG: hypothetical protein ACREVG_09225 [Burkholderiales bacterium]
MRKFGFFLWLAIALAVGQHAGLLHGLAHAAEKVAQKQDSKPAQTKCEQCSLCAQLAGAASAPQPSAAVVAGLVPAAPFVVHAAPVVSTVVFLSRAPPVLL